MNVLLAVLVGGISAAPAPASHSGALVPFAITLERTERGWSATCARGCFWESASVSCARECPAVIDATGISTSLRATDRPSEFAFVVERTPRGWKATSRSGTAWIETRWECGAGACSARIDETGVGRQP